MKLKHALNRVAAIAAWVAGIGILAGGMFVAAFYVAMRVEMRSTEIDVPDLQGMTFEAALRESEPLGLVLEVVDQRNDPRVPSGRVLEQMPRAGDAVRRGRKLKLVMSLGGRVLLVPDLVDQASRAVALELAREGFSPGDEARVPRAGVATGRIIGQVPAAGSTAVPNSQVHRLVSDGPPETVWVMPDLTGLPREEAERFVEESGFRRGRVRPVADLRRLPGTVVAQRPPAGHPIRERDIVELTVAR